MLANKIYFAEDLVPIVKVGRDVAEELDLQVTRAKLDRLLDELNAQADHEAYVGQTDITPGTPTYRRVDDALSPLSGDVRVRSAIAGSGVLTGVPEAPRFASLWWGLGAVALVGFAFAWTHKGKVWR